MKHILITLIFSMTSVMPLKAKETLPARWETDNLSKVFNVSAYPSGIEKELFCSSVLLINNKFSPTKCYYEKGDELAKNVTNMFRLSTLKLNRHRAKLDGKTKSVRFGFTLKLLTKDDRQELLLLHALDNISENADFKYFAPQRITAVRPVISLRGCNFDTGFWINVSVDSMGRATSVKVADGIAKEKCLRSVKQQFLEARYIPAQRAGEVSPGVYKEHIECLIKSRGCKLRFETGLEF